MSTSSRILEYTAQIQQYLDKINAEAAMGAFQTPIAESPKSESTVFPPEYRGTIKQLLVLAPGLSEIQFRKLVDNETAKAAGLLTLEAGIHLAMGNLGFEIDGTEVKRSLPAVENMAPTKSELLKDGIDFNLVDYLRLGTVIKGKGRLEHDLWKQYDKILFADGYKYNYDEKQWNFQSRDAKQEQSQPSKAAPTKDRALKVIRISDLSIDLKSPTIEGQLLDDPIQRDVNTAHGPTSVTSFRLDDGTGEVRVSLWGDLANSAMSLVSGDRIQITSLMVKPPFDGMTQVNSGNWSKLTKL